MKILITGATGLVGGAIIDLCLKKGIAVHFLTTSRTKVNSKQNCTGFYWNPQNSEIDTDCFTGVDAIINLAGASIAKRWTAIHKEEILQSRLKSLTTLYKGLCTLKNHDIKSLVSASGVGIYPNSLSQYYTEDHEAVDDSFLGKVVAQWETAADVFKTLNIKVSKIRIGLVLSLHGGVLTEMDKTIKNYIGFIFGKGEQWQSWIHITDLSRLFLFVVESDLEGVYNGVAPNPVTHAKMTKEIAKKRNKPLILPNIPEFALNTLLGEMSYVLFSSQRVSSKKIEEEGFTFTYKNICLALDGLYSDNEHLPTNKNILIGH